jgi:hypothetical protein
VLSSGGGFISGASVPALQPPADPDAPAAPLQPDYARPAIALAVEALRRFGGEMTRETAYELLQYWRRKDELTAPQVGVVLRRFPSAAPAPAADLAAGHAEALATLALAEPEASAEPGE